MLHFKNVVSVCKYYVPMNKNEIIRCVHVGTLSMQIGQLFIILTTFKLTERQTDISIFCNGYLFEWWFSFLFEQIHKQ